MPNTLSPQGNPTVITSQPARNLMGVARKSMDEGFQMSEMQRQRVQTENQVQMQQNQQFAQEDAQRRQEFEMKSSMEQLKASLSNG